jgi:primary-amine oxidase
MESRNAILLSRPAAPGAAFAFDDYGVGVAHCVPPEVPPFAYEGMRAFGLDGKEMTEPRGVEELRKEAELFHRIKVEL